MRYLIFGSIGVLWGGFILLGYILKGGPEGDGAFLAGQFIGLLWGALLFGAGLYYAIRGMRKVRTGSRKTAPMEPQRG